MKSNYGASDNSMSIERCAIKLRFLMLVANTGNLINERATPTLGVNHALLAPIAIFTVYIFLIVMVIGAMRQKYASLFLQVYALVVCIILEASLSIAVFKELMYYKVTNRHAAIVLDGLLPMIILLLLLADLVVLMFSSREEVTPSLPADSRSSSPITVLQESNPIQFSM